ncbi:MAG TPA: CmpA/NrtA family ABC transporter substrate-binding protein [Dehalococcoidia bacterium]|nr:CmpA/NrtA family ABC transporter substrate-binding protein [Dehalococcoidia bacterium]
MRVNRRDFLKMAGVTAAAVAATPILSACGDDGSSPEVASGSPPAAGVTAGATTTLRASSDEKIKIGFIALTDCASVVMAHELGFFEKYGLNVDVLKQASWASLRDGLLTGDLHAAHMLFGMPFSVYTGVGGPAGKEIHIAMVLDNNGQGITLSQDKFGGKVGFRSLTELKTAVDALKAEKEVTFAMTFPGGTHDIWLRYWLAAAGVDQDTVKIITIPPPQMVANMKSNAMDGYSVGEPWNGIGVKDGIGFTAIASQDIWKQHPEKALGVNPDFAAKRRDDLKLVMRAILEASQFIDDPANKVQVANTIGGSAYVNASDDVIAARLEGKYDLGGGLGEHIYTDDTMFFYNNGFVNAPRIGHAAWFMAQYVRFGYLSELPDTQAIAKKLILSDLYGEVARDMGIAVPDDDMAPFTLALDGATFDPADPQKYLSTYGGIS